MSEKGMTMTVLVTTLDAAIKADGGNVDAINWRGPGIRAWIEGIAAQITKTQADPVLAVALDIARWFVNGDRPDEFKLKEWAERLDRDAIAKAYEERK